MKYVSLLALAVAFAPTFVMAATTEGTGHANAKIVKPVTVEEDQQLNFGTMLGKANTVTINTSGGTTRTATDSSGLVTDTNTPTTGVFTVTGPNSQPITVSIPSGTTVTSGSNSMTISNLNSPQSGSQTLDGSGSLTINVGGDLTVGANQAEGDYTGTYTITINY